MIFDWPDKTKIDYVLSHFRMNYHLPEKIEQLFVFGDAETEAGSIVFKLSQKDIPENMMLIDGIPILFPIEESHRVFDLADDKLVFYHDILKSAFYLLSGYQEYKSAEIDHFGRFPYKDSMQKKLGFADKPVVNYYFQWIAEALNVYAQHHHFPSVKKKPLFYDGHFGFFLTHDVDKIDYFTFNEMVFRAKQLFGIANAQQNRFKSLKLLWDAKWNYFFTRKNPAWDFEHLISVEKKYRIPATYFFLDKDLKHQDAYYRINDTRIKKLIQWLMEQGAEIGVHGVCRSSTDQSVMRKQLDRFTSVLGESSVGVRQHRLIYKNPTTLQIHQEHGFKYDSTLAFAEHEGFRNSYCRPFRVFDHENNRMTDVWEFPLNVMDVTLFYYQNYNLKEAKQAIRNIVEEVRKFNGLFTMLWHNGFNDEQKLPGIRKFYEELIHDVIKAGGEGISAKNLPTQLDQHAG